MTKGISRRELIGKLGLAGGAATFAAAAAAQSKDKPLPAGLPVFDVRAFGAAADGKTLNTTAIQSAVDACAGSGGGIVFFPPGRFLTGGIILKSRVTLHFSPGTMLLGSTRLEDYPVERPAVLSRTRAYVQHALIYGEDLDHIGLEGPGVLDGQGAEFRRQFGDAYLKRPYLVRLVNCRDVHVADVTLTASAMWTMHLLACQRVRVEGVRIWAHVASNNDGIDVNACENVVISDSFVDSDDDAIVLKSTLHRASRNVAVTNCVLASHCNAFKMGTESLGGFQNITLSNCVIQSPPASERINGVQRGISALALEAVDGAVLERIAVSNLVIQGYEAAIFLRLGNRGALLQDTDAKAAVGTYRGVTISHIVGDNIGKTGCAVAGIPGHPVRDVRLEDISLRFEGGGTPEQAGRLDVPERESDYPEATMFGVLPAYGLYARHVQNLRLRDLDLDVVTPDARPPLVFQAVERLEITGLSARADAAAGCAFRLRNVKDAFIHGCRYHGSAAKAADVDPSCRGVRISGNAFDAHEAAK